MPLQIDPVLAKVPVPVRRASDPDPNYSGFFMFFSMMKRKGRGIGRRIPGLSDIPRSYPGFPEMPSLRLLEVGTVLATHADAAKTSL